MVTCCLSTVSPSPDITQVRTEPNSPFHSLLPPSIRCEEMGSAHLITNRSKNVGGQLSGFSFNVFVLSSTPTSRSHDYRFSHQAPTARSQRPPMATPRSTPPQPPRRGGSLLRKGRRRRRRKAGRRRRSRGPCVLVCWDTRWLGTTLWASD